MPFSKLNVFTVLSRRQPLKPQKCTTILRRNLTSAHPRPPITSRTPAPFRPQPHKPIYRALSSTPAVMAPSEPTPNTTARATTTVLESDLASQLSLNPGDDYPPVYATSRMIALMEIAAARVLVPHLEPGELSVGVAVDMVHSAATPVGAEVTAEATFVGKEGKLFAFEVVCWDNGGEVGRARHTRAKVVKERIESGAKKRMEGSKL